MAVEADGAPLLLLTQHPIDSRPGHPGEPRQLVLRERDHSPRSPVPIQAAHGEQAAADAHLDRQVEGLVQLLGKLQDARRKYLDEELLDGGMLTTQLVEVAAVDRERLCRLERADGGASQPVRWSLARMKSTARSRTPGPDPETAGLCR